ncbi:hypothetical protein RCO48_08620 [Peribacillus frigoritolerans]|nr:hypothetical protein [Peribacillus frigoritolerans]
MMILKAVKEDAQSILVIQKVSYIREAELYNNYEIAPLTETLDQIKEDFQKKVILKFIIEDKIIGSVRGHEKKRRLLCRAINGTSGCSKNGELASS